MTLRKLLTNENYFNNIVTNSFNSLDTDKSGAIEINEFSALVKKLAKLGDIQEPSKKEVEKIFNILDKDNSGSIGIEEYKYLVLRIFEMED